MKRAVSRTVLDGRSIRDRGGLACLSMAVHANAMGASWKDNSSPTNFDIYIFWLSRGPKSDVHGRKLGCGVICKNLGAPSFSGSSVFLAKCRIQSPGITLWLSWRLVIGVVLYWCISVILTFFKIFFWPSPCQNFYGDRLGDDGRAIRFEMLAKNQGMTDTWHH